jgi:hypothetical protein
VETLLELSKRQSPDLGFWVWQILMPLMTIPSLRDYLQPFAAQALHAHTPAQISPHRDLRGKEILDSLQQHGSVVVPTVRPRQLCEGPYNYCKGSIALQKQPSQGIESIALKVKSESAYRLPNYRCTLCYLDLEDNGWNHGAPSSGHVSECRTLWLPSPRLGWLLASSAWSATIAASPWFMHHLSL